MSVARITAITAAVTMSCALGAAGTAAAAAQSYGTIAISKLKNAGVVTVGNSKVTADAAAIRDCANYDCDIVFRFTDGCGALAQGADGIFGWAAASSREEAEAAAVAGLGRSNPPFPDLGSASPQAAKVVASTCTGGIQ
ncbi:DUF4189 domain-containing protein [Nocardia acidivorans]|uniref:DUF4189 domain-containing protein n=1 Tax=Nocardia acidivorans TaxID=404580 RepID=UPI000A944BD8|nr:DUF4189 domain-containing protein [Nocardia acidivorans]